MSLHGHMNVADTCVAVSWFKFVPGACYQACLVPVPSVDGPGTGSLFLSLFMSHCSLGPAISFSPPLVSSH